MNTTRLEWMRLQFAQPEVAETNVGGWGIELLDHIAQLEAQRGEDPVCTCRCHRTAGMLHSRACCGPGTGKRSPEPGGAVVVPPWDVNAFVLACVKPGVYVAGDLRNALKDAEAVYSFAVSRIQPIPASQVLQPGMAQVDRDRLEHLVACANSVLAACDPDCNTFLSGHFISKASESARRSQAGGEG